LLRQEAVRLGEAVARKLAIDLRADIVAVALTCIIVGAAIATAVIAVLDALP
jgi:hypothetical protein